MPNTFKEFMRTEEASQYLRVSRQYLEAARCRGDGPPFSKIGRSVIYNRDDLDKFMRERSRTATHTRSDSSTEFPPNVGGAEKRQHNNVRPEHSGPGFRSLGTSETGGVS
jgi:excisionase family DNA binding protein